MKPRVKVFLGELLVVAMVGLVLFGAAYNVINQRHLFHARIESAENLRHLVSALHAYHKEHGRFPSAEMYGPDGKTSHSWRVALLPFLEEKERHSRYRFDEPWDSEHNRQLLKDPPWVFRQPAIASDGNTPYFALVGEKTLFPPNGHIRMADADAELPDVIAFVEARRKIPWTKPEDIPYDANEPLPKLGGFFDQLFNVGLGDGLAGKYKFAIDADDEMQVVGVSDDEFRDHMTISDNELAEISAERVRDNKSANSLKWLGRGLQKYLSKYERLPSAVMYGPDGKTVHSWRVALLPFLHEQELYDEYRFDEPWDSEHNSRLIEKIPSVYQHSLDDRPAGNTSFFAIVGPVTVFASGEYLQFLEFPPALPNAVTFVEARRDVPWTKPEDIPYHTGMPLPKFGGFHERFFHTANGNGTVTRFSQGDDDTLRDQIVLSDDELVAISAIRVHGQESAEATTALRDGDGCCADPEIDSDASRIRKAQNERLSELLDSVLKTKSVDQADGE